MSKAKIISNEGDALYTVQIQFNTTFATARIEALRQKLIDLVQPILDAELAIITLDNQRNAVADDLDAVLEAARDYEEPPDHDTVVGLVKQIAELNQQRITLEANLRSLKLQRASTASEKTAIEDHIAGLSSTAFLAYCADYTEDLPADAEVSLALIPGELSGATINIMPAHEATESGNAGKGAAWDEADGVLTPPFSMTPAACFYNWAILPGWQRWRPILRHGTITAIAGDLAEVRITDVRSSVRRYYGGAGVTAGLNVNRDNGITYLSNVSASYMTCNMSAFSVDDEVIVRIDQGETWENPTIIGFKGQPRQCPISGPFAFLMHPRSDSEDGTGRYLSDAVHGMVYRDTDTGNWRGIPYARHSSFDSTNARYMALPHDYIFNDPDGELEYPIHISWLGLGRNRYFGTRIYRDHTPWYYNVTAPKTDNILTGIDYYRTGATTTPQHAATDTYDASTPEFFTEGSSSSRDIYINGKRITTDADTNLIGGACLKKIGENYYLYILRDDITTDFVQVYKYDYDPVANTVSNKTFIQVFNTGNTAYNEPSHLDLVGAYKDQLRHTWCWNASGTECITLRYIAVDDPQPGYPDNVSYNKYVMRVTLDDEDATAFDLYKSADAESLGTVSGSHALSKSSYPWSYNATFSMTSPAYSEIIAVDFVGDDYVEARLGITVFETDTNWTKNRLNPIVDEFDLTHNAYGRVVKGIYITGAYTDSHILDDYEYSFSFSTDLASSENVNAGNYSLSGTFKKTDDWEINYIDLRYNHLIITRWAVEGSLTEVSGTTGFVLNDMTPKMYCDHILFGEKETLTVDNYPDNDPERVTGQDVALFTIQPLGWVPFYYSWSLDGFDTAINAGVPQSMLNALTLNTRFNAVCYSPVATLADKRTALLNFPVGYPSSWPLLTDTEDPTGERWWDITTGNRHWILRAKGPNAPSVNALTSLLDLSGANPRYAAIIPLMVVGDTNNVDTNYTFTPEE